MKPDHRALPSTDTFLAAWTLLVDRLTAELTEALARRGIPSILLKGPSFARWLYRDGAVRGYGDCDLLVPPDGIPAAQAVLGELGFSDASAPLAHPRLESHGWVRSDDSVDLHSTLIGIRASPQVVWDTLSAMVETQLVGGVSVHVLTAPARALHVALHAAQHGPHERQPLEDLRRAIEVVPGDMWFEVAALAERLEATEAFATGLRLIPTGTAVASRLGLASAASTDATLRLKPVPLALAFDHLASTPGLKARLAIVLRELVPTTAFMRWWSPLARRGPVGLLAAYCWRPLWLLARVVPGFRAWRRAQRASG